MEAGSGTSVVGLPGAFKTNLSGVPSKEVELKGSVLVAYLVKSKKANPLSSAEWKTYSIDWNKPVPGTKSFDRLYAC